jgi:hypothetical protein
MLSDEQRAALKLMGRDAAKWILVVLMMASICAVAAVVGYVLLEAGILQGDSSELFTALRAGLVPLGVGAIGFFVLFFWYAGAMKRVRHGGEE